MSEPNRSPSCWSSSVSTATKFTSATNQTTPLIVLRRKLFRQSANTKKKISDHLAKSKHDIHELFNLYYSNNVKFDTFQRQIVTGTRIPTAQASSLSQENLTTSSTNVFNAKHFVSREQWSTLDLDINNEQQLIDNETAITTTRTIPISTSTKKPTAKRSVQIRVDNNIIIHPTVNFFRPNISPVLAVSVLPNSPERTSSPHREDFTESPLVKSTAFIGDVLNESPETPNKKSTKSHITQRPVSSKSSLINMPQSSTVAPMSANSKTNRKDTIVQSNASFSTVNSLSQRRSSRSSILTGSAVVVRQRSPTKLSWSRSRAKSNLTITTIESLSGSNLKTGSPSTSSRLSNEPDLSELPLVTNSQRVVSIPSKCSRYVLVSLPEPNLRYGAPSYVERLLLPERFPTLYQNIVQSYDHHLTSAQHHRNAK